MYAVTGATGNTGRVVAEALLAAGKDVQVIGRSAERLGALVQKGAEAYVGDVSDAQAMSLALSGAVGVYCMIPPRFDSKDFPGYQRKVGEALAASIHEAGVEHAVFLSSVGAQQGEPMGSISGLRKQEERLNALAGVNVLSLRAGWFMENLCHSLGAIRDMGVLGTPLKGDLPLPMVATRDIGEYAARRLVALDFTGNVTQELLGPREVTMEEVAGLLGKAIGVDDLPYVQYSYEDFEKAAAQMGISRSGAQTLVEMYRAYNDGLVVPEEERSSENTTDTTIEEFVQSLAKGYSG
jgi:uncharacterized protein YbjT (DUF2867 family)